MSTERREEEDGRPTLKDCVTVGDLERAKRRALAILDDWQECTGALRGSYVGEVESIVEDAVEIGVQAAFGIKRLLEAEVDAAENSIAKAREAQASPSVSCSNDGGNQIPDPPVALPEQEEEAAK